MTCVAREIASRWAIPAVELRGEINNGYTVSERTTAALDGHDSQSNQEDMRQLRKQSRYNCSMQLRRRLAVDRLAFEEYIRILPSEMPLYESAKEIEHL